MSSMNNLSQDGEFRYILQWFNEWSELQRDDFVPVLVDYLTAAPATAEEINSNSVCMNGLVHAINNTGVHDRPMSLFQCRIKLFRQWSIKWPQDFKVKLQESIMEIDVKVGEKILNELKTETGVNGDSAAFSSNENEINNASTVRYVDSTEGDIVPQLLNHESLAPVTDDSLDNNSSSDTATTTTIMAENSNSSEPAEPVLIVTPPEHVATATAIPI